jgi:hypothetical protein
MHEPFQRMKRLLLLVRFQVPFCVTLKLFLELLL